MLALANVCESINIANFENVRQDVIGALLQHVNPEDFELTALALKSINTANVIAKGHFENDQTRNFILQKITESI